MPANDEELRYWLQNMIWYHRFREDEVAAATGLTPDVIASAMRRFDIRRDNAPPRPPDAPLLVLPYPGGRHPRIGFQEGAIDPQRETKLSIFTPWDPASYVVVDVPEALWSQEGLIYLAHTHIPTVWTNRGVRLAPLEWNRRNDGTFDIQRRLPDGTVFGTRAAPRRDRVDMHMWLYNGTDRPLSNLVVQVCVLLKAAAGFDQLSDANKVLEAPFAACGSENRRRWIITAWEPCHRVWANPAVPCMHADPRFPDCPPGTTVRLRGSLWFYEGEGIGEYLRQLRAAGLPAEPTARSSDSPVSPRR